VNRSEPAPQGVGSLSFHDQEVSMSRYTITVTGNRRTDPNAVIGYDPPLRTFFLQAFPDESSDDLALWLGTSDREYETLDALQAAARSRGFDVMPLPDDIAARLAVDVAAEVHRPPHDGPLAALLRHLQSK
jgi:Lon protease-like protein